MSEHERSTSTVEGGMSVPANDIRGVLRIKPFRTLWIALGLSSLGDWLGLLALTAMAGQLAAGNYRAENFAIAGVLLLRLLPAVVVGPLGGYIADRLDRRWTLVVGDVVRFVLFASIPIVGTLWWLYVATVLIEAVSLIWLPSKDAAVPNLVPRDRLAVANQVSMVTTYGSALPAALLFTFLALINSSLVRTFNWFNGGSVDLALYFNALTFLVGALVVARLREVSGRPSSGEITEEQTNVLKAVIEGWRFVAQNRLIRGLVIGVVGAFAAGGVVIGLGRTYVTDLGGGAAGYGVLFGALFTGLAIGMALGPRFLVGLSRRRMFGLTLTAAGVSLIAVALVQNLVLVAFCTVLLGAFAGITWITGYTLLGLEVEDSIRGRTFAFVQSLTKIALAAVLAAAPAIAGSIGAHGVELPGKVTLTYNGASITFLLAGIAATAFGLVSFRQMDDRPGVSVLRDVRAVFSGHDRGFYADTGLFIAFEGGEGAGKSTQAKRLAGWLEDQGHTVTVTHEPGATDIGRELRQLLLHGASGISPRTEALLYAADKAEHVDSMIKPVLAQGAVVITDRYVDSALAYQGGGRDLSQSDLVRLSRWATGGLRPHLTVLLDVPPEAGLARGDGTPDRLEREPLEFHTRVRQQFLDLAALDPERYAVLDATRPVDELAAQIRDAVRPLLGGVGGGVGDEAGGPGGAGGADRPYDGTRGSGDDSAPPDDDFGAGNGPGDGPGDGRQGDPSRPAQTVQPRRPSEEAQA
ncbi:dTMP kinase [Actinopolymorpha cephalotaxi]|uniref:Thymidylate kinase n=2 Tax=Actinopolymorpha cephalotaxi TaxID=504797 RepID=A0ABX2S8Y3_9ACTN|nr:dTMP kinase [Actinopolymorpha cephalotaxi]NYH85744.1 dTMP kinase [Actinopolymorpha cephalotaxi]